MSTKEDSHARAVKGFGYMDWPAYRVLFFLFSFLRLEDRRGTDTSLPAPGIGDLFGLSC